MRTLISIAALLASPPAAANVFPLPAEGGDAIGMTVTAEAGAEDTLLDLARRYGLGYEEITNANPGVDPWLPGAGTVVVMPKQRLLLRAPRSGIVINLPEHRLYWYPPTPAGQQPVVWTFPVSIGKMDWNTPLGSTTIVSKAKDAPWIPPQSVREEHEKRGDPLPAIVPGGADNPMGRYKMALGIPGGAYLIHGTNKPAGIGMQVTHGCMRLYPEDIETLYAMVPIGTTVTIVNQPYKWGWHDGELLIEVHPPLQEGASVAPSLTDLTRLIVEATRASPVAVDWIGAERTWREARGVPTPVSAGVPRTVSLVPAE
ncbi:MAG: LysM peptidoglycan-binding domain-containing protein [Gammaproteobacteria bacterium]|nr:LysM peptidoglycan-binding domain-containing protein [Gammaproteobacteria bacterium]